MRQSTAAVALLVAGPAGVAPADNEIIAAPAILQTNSATTVAFTSPGGAACTGNNITLIAAAASGNNPIGVV